MLLYNHPDSAAPVIHTQAAVERIFLRIYLLLHPMTAFGPPNRYVHMASNPEYFFRLSFTGRSQDQMKKEPRSDATERCLPQELIDIIINEIPSNDHRTLSSCALVARSWVYTSQRCLHSRFAISFLESEEAGTAARSTGQRFAHLLSTAPHIASFVENLSIKNAEGVDPQQPWFMFSKSAWETIFPGLGNLLSLFIEFGYYDYGDDILVFKDLLRRAFSQLPRLREVTLNQICPFIDVYGIFSLFQGAQAIRHISLCDVVPSSDAPQAGADTAKVVLPIDCLTLSLEYSDFIRLTGMMVHLVGDLDVLDLSHVTTLWTRFLTLSEVRAATELLHSKETVFPSLRILKIEMEMLPTEFNTNIVLSSPHSIPGFLSP
ncbi:uncharacterized protein BT62DRAFT_41381 [Guyanagaster necrorhizus]|uniref:F-box domain-containing protein n=1 Tax=Guyanagaster necrorhizus TaxID=856835 RepID=A0A9P7W7Z2_9AGAR|nr:uncharacterized protein BT62DRAFT_41381 [Guyanagaster necrorhizus MCA 3950]KAG7452996.1 hypothetical protein BT62DRAFT_41381 [Guyanagaster necrorhizus MCA 3950]